MARSEERRRRLAVALAAGCVSATVACNAIIGLSDFEKTECPGRICPYDGGDANTFDVLPSDGGADGGDATTPRGAGPVSWARFPMPNYVIDAASPPPNPPNLTAGAGDTVNDGTTKLVWRNAPAMGGANLSFDKALAACDEIAPKGTWRLPKRIELVTLLMYGQNPPYNDRSVFAAVPDVQAWTSSEKRPFSATEPEYWVVDFGSGKVVTKSASLSAIALCVKGL